MTKSNIDIIKIVMDNLTIGLNLLILIPKILLFDNLFLLNFLRTTEIASIVPRYKKGTTIPPY